MTEPIIFRIWITGMSVVAMPWIEATQGQAPTSSAYVTTIDDRESVEDALKIFRAPLLREGSNLVQVKSTVSRDASTGEWKLLVDTANPGNADVPRYELIVLPCSRLAEMQRIIEASPDHRVTFQVSGEVLVFRGRNYLLPTYTPVLTEEIVLEPIPATEPENQVKPKPEPQPIAGEPPASTRGATTAPSAPSAQDISRELEKAAGPLRRSGARTADNATDSQSGASSATRPARDSERRSAAPASTVHPEKLLREGTMLTARRGKLSRDGSGGWTFIFDADASGLADPPVRLLPCMLLERIEDYARRVGNNSPALLSGPIYLYAGRNYMLPTVFRIPQDRRNLTP